MASTPSASALNAVLRCRGNVWTRNTPSKRPATSGYSLGLGVGTQRDSQPERTRSSQTSAKEASLQGDRVVVGRRLVVAYASPRVDGGALRGKDFTDVKRSVYPKLRRLSGRAQLARRPTPELPGADTCSKITHIIKCETQREGCARVQQTSGSAAGVVKVSVMSSVVLEHAGHLLNTLRSTCLSVTALVSERMLWKPRSSTTGGAAHLHCQEEEKRCVPVANGHSSADLASTQRDPSCAQKITEDRPD